MIEEFYQASRVAILLCYRKINSFNITKVTCHKENNEKHLLSNQTKNLSFGQEVNKKSNFFCKNTNLIKKNELFYKPSSMGFENFSNQPGFVFYQDNCDNIIFKTDRNIITNLTLKDKYEL